MSSWLFDRISEDLSDFIFMNGASRTLKPVETVYEDLTVMLGAFPPYNEEDLEVFLDTYKYGVDYE